MTELMGKDCTSKPNTLNSAMGVEIDLAGAERRLNIIGLLKVDVPSEKTNHGLPVREGSGIKNTPKLPPMPTDKLNAMRAALEKEKLYSTDTDDGSVESLTTHSLVNDESTQEYSGLQRVMARLHPASLYARAQTWNYSRKRHDQDESREEWGTKKKATVIALGVMAASAGAYVYYKYGIDSKSVHGGGTVNGPANLSDNLSQTPNLRGGGPGSSRASENSTDWSKFSRSARHATYSEGWNNTFMEMNIPKDKWAEVLRDAGPRLQKLGEAYNDSRYNNLGISRPGPLSNDALEAIVSAARKNGVEL